MESLEDYLSGSLEPVEERAIEAHMAVCESCRTELSGMRTVSQLFVSLRPPSGGLSGSFAADAVIEDVALEDLSAPSPGFYGRVLREVETRRTAPSFSGFFALDFAFGRRLVLSSFLTLVVVGGFLVSREAGYAGGPAPDSVLAQQEAPGFNSASASDSMLATLTSYEH
jgi:anti-sigma factor RsiW